MCVFEIHEYPALTVATTKRAGDDNSSMHRFRYNDRANDPKEKIDMTNGDMNFLLPEKNKPVRYIATSVAPWRMRWEALQESNTWLDANNIRRGLDRVAVC